MIRLLIADLLFIGGLVSIGYGAWMISPAFAYILLGVITMIFAAFLSGTKSSIRGRQ